MALAPSPSSVRPARRSGVSMLKAIEIQRRSTEPMSPPDLERLQLEATTPRSLPKKSYSCFFLQKPSEDSSMSMSLCSAPSYDSLPTLTVVVEGVSVAMTADPSSSVTIVSEDVMRKHFKNHAVQPTLLTVRLSGGHDVQLDYCLAVRVDTNHDEELLVLHVAQGAVPPIMGRDWINVFKSSLPDLSKIAPQVHLLDYYDQLTQRYATAFRETSDGTVLREVKARIRVERKTRPLHQRCRPTACTLLPGLKAELNRLESQGIISRVEDCDWASSVVVQVRGDGSIRLTADFKSTLNQLVSADAYAPLPDVPDLLTPLVGCRIFSTINISRLEMEVYKDDRRFLTINTELGYYVYNRLPHGLKVASRVWHKAVEQIVQGLPGVVVHLNRVVVAGADDITHLQRLEMVCERFCRSGLKIHLDTATLFRRSVSLCGWQLDERGLRSEGSQIDTMTKVIRPETAGQLKCLLALVDHYSCYLTGVERLTDPLNDLLDSTGGDLTAELDWTKKADQSFKALQNLMASGCLSCPYDSTKPLVLSCTSSGSAMAAVLWHAEAAAGGREKPVVTLSRRLDAPQKSYSHIERKALSLAWAVESLESYLCGRSFVLLTDDRLLTSVMSARRPLPSTLSARLLFYTSYLQAFDYELQWRSSDRSVVLMALLQLADRGSGVLKADDVAAFQINQLQQLPVAPGQLAKATTNEPGLAAAFQWLATGDACLRAYLPGDESEYSIQDGCILRGTRVVIPQRFRRYILNTLHERHDGAAKMKALAASAVWWPGIDQDIVEVTKDCEGCVRQARSDQAVPLHPWEQAWKPWQKVHIEFAGPVVGSVMLLVVIDDYSRWPEVLPMGLGLSASKIIDGLKILWSRYGLPEIIVSANAPQLVTVEFQDFLRCNHVKHLHKAGHHPSGIYGHIDKFIRVLKKGLTSSAAACPSQDLTERLAAFLSHYRCSSGLVGTPKVDRTSSHASVRTHLERVAPKLRPPSSSNFINSVDDLLLVRKYRRKWRLPRRFTKSTSLDDIPLK